MLGRMPLAEHVAYLDNSSWQLTAHGDKDKEGMELDNCTEVQGGAGRRYGRVVG